MTHWRPLVNSPSDVSTWCGCKKQPTSHVHSTCVLYSRKLWSDRTILWPSVNRAKHQEDWTPSCAGLVWLCLGLHRYTSRIMIGLLAQNVKAIIGTLSTHICKQTFGILTEVHNIRVCHCMRVCLSVSIYKCTFELNICTWCKSLYICTWEGWWRKRGEAHGTKHFCQINQPPKVLI